MTITTRQFTMLSLIAPHGLPLSDALTLHQTTFGSCCYRQWVMWSPRRKQFELSATGRALYLDNRNMDLHRANSLPAPHLSTRVTGWQSFSTAAAGRATSQYPRSARSTPGIATKPHLVHRHQSQSYTGAA